MEAVRDMGRAVTRWHTWVLMGNQDIKLRYRRSVIGPFWISLSLAALVFALSILYSQIFVQPFAAYLHWLSAGLLVWYLVSSLITEGCTVAIEAESQLRSVDIPIPVLAARMVYRNWIVFLHNLVVVIALTAVFHFTLTFETLWIVPGVVTVLAIGFFAAVILGPMCLRFRDIPQVITNIVQIVFFLTPILWYPSQGRVAESVVAANPFYHIIELVRAPLLGQAPTQLNWLVAGGVLGACLLIAWLVLATSRRRIFLWL